MEMSPVVMGVGAGVVVAFGMAMSGGEASTKLLLIVEAILRLVLEVLFVFPMTVLSALLALLSPVTYMTKKKKFESIFITGASSGLGAALALKLAKSDVQLFLTARREEKLKEIAEQCRSKGAKVEVIALDVTDRSAIAAAVEKADAMKPIDCMIANAGVSLGMLNLKPNPNDMFKALLPLTDVNVCGVYATVAAIAPLMCKRRKGQIVIMSSSAGNFPMWDEPSYTASKVAVRYFGESLRPLLRNYKVGISVVTPWFVKSGSITDKLTKGKPETLPFVVSEKEAMRITIDGIQRNVAVIGFPFIPQCFTYFLGTLPLGLRSLLYTFLNTKRGARKMIGEPAGIEERSYKKAK